MPIRPAMTTKRNDNELERGTAEQVQSQLDKIARGLAKLDDAVITLADSDSMVGVAKIIATRLDLRTGNIVEALDAQSDEPMRVVCRAAGLNINAFSAILRLRRRRLRGGELSPAEALAAYYRIESATPADVRRLLKLEAE